MSLCVSIKAVGTIKEIFFSLGYEKCVEKYMGQKIILGYSFVYVN